MKLLKQATYITYVLAKLSKFLQISTQTSSGFLENQKRPGTSFQAIIFTEFFNKKISFVMLQKLATFHHQTVFTSQVIHLKVFRVSWLGI